MSLFVVLIQELGAEVSDTFIVLIYDQYVKVISPAKLGSRTNVIIENKSLNKIVGKIISKNRKFVRYVTVESESTDTVELNLKYDKRFFYIPMAPSFQGVELLAGMKSYAIPPQK